MVLHRRNLCASARLLLDPRMKNILIVMFLVTVAGVFTVATGGKINPGNTSGTPVTTYLSDVDNTATAYYMQSDAQKGPVNGVLGEYDNGQQNVISFLNANTYNSLPPGDWTLNLLNSTVRTMRLTFDSQLNAIPAGQLGSNPPPNPPFWGTQSVVSKFQEDCTAVNLDIGTMSYVGQAFNCPAIFRFNQSGTSNYYRLYMYGSWGSAAPESTWVHIQCNSLGSNGYCNDWFVDPIPVVNADGTTSPGKTIARLTYITTKGSGSETDEGDFYLTFHVHVTLP